MAQKFANNAASKLAAPIDAAATACAVTPGDGAKFPTLAAGDFFMATIVKATGELEIVKVTARATDAFTITRAQENTPAIAFAAGDRIEARLTKGAIDKIVADIDANAAAIATMTAPFRDYAPLLYDVVGSTSPDAFFSNAPVSTPTPANRFRLKIGHGVLPRPSATVGPLGISAFDKELSLSVTGELGQDGTINTTTEQDINIFIVYNNAGDTSLVASTGSSPTLTAPSLTKYTYWHRIMLAKGSSSGWALHHRLRGNEVEYNGTRQVSGGATAGNINYEFAFYNTLRDFVKALSVQVYTSMATTAGYAEGTVSISSNSASGPVSESLKAQVIASGPSGITVTGYGNTSGVVQSPGGTGNWVVYAFRTGGNPSTWYHIVNVRGYTLANCAVS